MCPSSSGSWPSGPGDIIDLDRYMRGNVRPSRALSDRTNQFEQLVVDGGGGYKTRSRASGDARYKRASLDSGVSDGSYRHTRRNRSKHGRSSHHGDSIYYPSHEPVLTKTLSGRANSSNSMRAFRTVCEQALLEQQQQIARVAELCERLTERAEKHEKTERIERNEQTESSPPERTKQSERNEGNSQKNVRLEKKAPSIESSEISSSSVSTKDLRRNDTNRTQECKTYKIIMTKLDELNRLFATRPHRTARPARVPRTPSSSSVSVCDKLVATDPQRTFNRVLAPTRQVTHCPASSVAPASLTSAAARSSRHANTRTVTQAFALDIAPRDPKDIRVNVLTESIVKCESSDRSSQHSACDPRCGFDLEDPVHLYSQAKRLQPKMRSRRAHSVEPASAEPWLDAHVHEHRKHVCEHARAPSLCAVCRGYWRYLRQCIPALVRVVNACKCS